jgi:hypothetical protein
MRVFASVLVFFVAAGCAVSPTSSSTSAVIVRGGGVPDCNTAENPLCTIMWEVNGVYNCSDNPWAELGTAGYLVTTPTPADPDTGIYNLLAVGFAQGTDFAYATDLRATPAQVFADKLWYCSLAPAQLSYFQTMPGTIPFVPAAPTPPPGGGIIPAALPVQGGDEGVGQVGSVDVPLGTGGNEPGLDITLDPGEFAKLASYQCIPKETTKADWCGTANCGEVVDDCNIPHSCGQCNGRLYCSSDTGAGHCVLPPTIPNPPCVGKCI